MAGVGRGGLVLGTGEGRLEGDARVPEQHVAQRGRVYLRLRRLRLRRFALPRRLVSAA